MGEGKQRRGEKRINERRERGDDTKMKREGKQGRRKEMGYRRENKEGKGGKV